MSRRGVREDMLAESFSVQFAVWAHNPIAESFGDLVEPRCARRDDMPGDAVRIDDGRPKSFNMADTVVLPHAMPPVRPINMVLTILECVRAVTTKRPSASSNTQC